jgi:sugar/nucleoside kinase (ribokinase family)
MSGNADCRYDVMMQGRAFCDLTFSFKHFDGLPALGQEVFADDFAINPGGIFNIVSVLTGLGVRVGWLTQLGNDIFSSFVGQQMKECGLSAALVQWVDHPLPVVTAGVSFAHDRLFLSYSAPKVADLPEPELSAEHFDRFRPRVLFTYGEVGIPLIREARRRGIMVYVDTFWNSEYLRSALLREVAASADLFAPNLDEALEMTGAGTAEDALQILSAWCPRAVIKRGANGCVAWNGSEQIAVPAIPVQARETTGAGDSFNAGLIYGLLLGYPFETCLRCANIAGGLSTAVLGGCRSGIRPADVDAWLERMEGGAT